jgi:hypothetical protein
MESPDEITTSSNAPEVEKNLRAIQALSERFEKDFETLDKIANSNEANVDPETLNSQLTRDVSLLIKGLRTSVENYIEASRIVDDTSLLEVNQAKDLLLPQDNVERLHYDLKSLSSIRNTYLNWIDDKLREYKLLKSVSTGSRTESPLKEYDNICTQFEQQPGKPGSFTDVGDIVGVEDIRKYFEDSIFGPILNKSLYPAGRNPKILLYGPPGTGKTAIVVAIFNDAMNNPLYKDKLKLLLFAPNTSSLGSKYKSESANIVTGTFRCANAMALKYQEETGIPTRSIVFIDEFDSIVPKRGSANIQQEDISVINALLQILDGVNRFNNVIFIGATNLPTKIDPAILSRMTFQSYVKRPDASDIAELLRKEIAKDLRRTFGFPVNSKDNSIRLLLGNLDEASLQSIGVIAYDKKLTGRDVVNGFYQALNRRAARAKEKNLFVEFPYGPDTNTIDTWYVSIDSFPPEIWEWVWKTKANQIKADKPFRKYDNLVMDDKPYKSLSYYPYFNANDFGADFGFVTIPSSWNSQSSYNIPTLLESKKGNSKPDGIYNFSSTEGLGLLATFWNEQKKVTSIPCVLFYAIRYTNDPSADEALFANLFNSTDVTTSIKDAIGIQVVNGFW